MLSHNIMMITLFITLSLHHYIITFYIIEFYIMALNWALNWADFKDNNMGLISIQLSAA